jgi:hypothetical protein
VNIRIGCQVLNRLLDSQLACVSGKNFIAADKTSLGGLSMLVAHVPLTGSIVTDKNRGQADSGGSGRFDRPRDLRNDLVPETIAVHDDRS